MTLARVSRRFVLAAMSLSALALGLAAGAAQAQAQDAPDKITLGYVLPLSGPFAPGATTTILPNYQLWAKQVNDAGGIHLKKYDKKVPVELIEYDDGSSVENSVRLYERLIIQDEVDLVLAPWGTGFNLAVAPVLNKHGMPHLAVTAVSNEQDKLVERWNNLFFFLASSNEYVDALVEVLKQLQEEDKLSGNKVAVTNVADQFGVELANAAVPRLEDAGFEVVFNKSYPPTVKDLSSLIKEMQALEPDAYLGFSYPGDTMMMTGQSVTLGYSPKVFLGAVGAAFPFYKGEYQDKAEGVIGFGGWDRSIAGADDYFKAHVEVIGKEPDRWASPVTYATLQILQQAIEEVGEIDKAKIIETIETKEFETIVGTFTMTDKHKRPREFLIGQWQDGEFVGIAPADMPGAMPASIKSGW